MQTGVLCCNALPCARNWVVEPSRTHEMAERSFGRAVQSICTTYTEDPLCLLVHGLHSCVVQGTVRRKAAAMAASSLHNVSYGEWSVTLVCILLGAKHNDDCACMEHVLSWGTCPHALVRLRDLTYTPLWWCMLRWSLGPPWPSLPLFLAHGAVPAPGIEHKGPDNALRPTLQVGTVNHRWSLAAMTAMHRQWVAWHCRSSRRWWIAVHV